jgi:hypothetical protein
MFVIALPLLILESAQAAPIVAPVAKPQRLVEPVQWYGSGPRCVAPYVSDGYRCVYGGYAQPYGGEDGPRYYRQRRYYRDSDGDYDGGVRCDAPYVSNGYRCVYRGYR